MSLTWVREALRRLAVAVAFVSVSAVGYGFGTIGTSEFDVLTDGEVALVFFLPNHCPACELVAEWVNDNDSLGRPVFFVSHASAEDLATWASRYPNLSVVRDAYSELGQALGVSEVPTIFMVADGRVVNADYWPFVGGLEGLPFTIQMSFSLQRGDLHSAIDFARLAETLAYGEGEPIMVGDLDLPASFILCSASCSVCDDEAQWLVESDLQLPTYVLVTSADPTSPSATPWDAAVGTTILHVDAESLGPVVTPAHFRLGRGFVVEDGFIGFSRQRVGRFLTAEGGSE